MEEMFPNTPLPDIIELKDINQSYEDNKYVIKDLNCLIENKPKQNQFVCLLGPSGCGKSTLLRYVAGLQEPTSGKVLLYGKERTDKDIVGMVFQKYSSFPWLTVLRNVSLGLELQGVNNKEALEKAMDMIKKVGLAGQEHKFAQYPTLSGGQLQRVALARSLLANPKILLMDEPFGALDINTRLQMQELLVKIWVELEEMTVMFVTHDIAESVYLGDEIWIMDTNPGKVIERIQVDLPLERNKLMKRDKKFVNIVYDIEDKMMQLSVKKKK
jgi:NitT/TauT family transport system ATP-binding protein